MTAPTDKPTPQTACEACGRGNVSVVAMPATYTKDGITVSYSDEYSVCDECGDEFYTKSQSSANSRAITTAIRQARNLPTGEEIRDARIGNLGMTLPQFEQAMCVGPNTVGRWERGTVAPSGAATGMLWVAINRPEVFLEFARSRGVVPRRIGVRGEGSQGRTRLSHT
jgi:putative zinc finger/helix-turn-helix YgiT family protein